MLAGKTKPFSVRTRAPSGWPARQFDVAGCWGAETLPRIGGAIYWIGPAGNAREGGEGTDFHAVAQGQVSITPLQVDLTDHAGSSRWTQRLAAGPR